MNAIDAIILGVVEGITEFLPISSTGHMILTSHLLGLKGSVIENFEVFIQLGAILAVVVLYRNRFKDVFHFSQETKGFSGKNAWMLLLTTLLPILLVGLPFGHWLKAHLFNPMSVIAALGVGGVIILGVEKLPFKHETQSLDQLHWKQALRIGLFQCLALWPGVSRSAATIIGGLSSGLDRQTAAEYSFIAAVPLMAIVCTKDLIEILPQLTPNDIQMYALGFVVSFISALVAVKCFVSLLQRFSLAPFGVYRIALAVIYGILFIN